MGVDVICHVFNVGHVFEIVGEPDFPATGGNYVAGAGPLEGSKVTRLHGLLEDQFCLGVTVHCVDLLIQALCNRGKVFKNEQKDKAFITRAT